MTSTANSNLGRELDQSFVAELLSGSRTRGGYDDILDEFYGAGIVGTEVELTGALAGKDALNVYTGLNNAKKKQDKDGNLVRPWGPSIKVIKKNVGTKENKDERIFLINTAMVDPEVVAQLSAGADEVTDEEMAAASEE